MTTTTPNYSGDPHSDEFWQLVHDFYMAAHAICDLSSDMNRDRVAREKNLATARRCVRKLATMIGVIRDGLFRGRLEELLGG